MTRVAALGLPLLLATHVSMCSIGGVRPTEPPDKATTHLSDLWVEPRNLAAADLFFGSWGPESAPDPNATYRRVKVKTYGDSPGLTVVDPSGKTWSVKQGDEGPVEVVLSRVLSAVGYHQPPVYYLPHFPLERENGHWIERAPGGRFRPHDKRLKDIGSWSWQQNPFVGMRPYHGLLVILLMFNSSDLKNSNNTLYAVREDRERVGTWLVVRDLGTALGMTGRYDPKRNDPDLFAREPFVERVDEHGFVVFHFGGFHQELFRHRMTAADVKWACDLLGRLSDAQWRDAFRAGGYDAPTAARFIARIKEKIVEGERLASEVTGA